MDTLETNARYLPLRGNIELNKAYRGILVKQLIKLVSNGEYIIPLTQEEKDGLVLLLQNELPIVARLVDKRPTINIFVNCHDELYVFCGPVLTNSERYVLDDRIALNFSNNSSMFAYGDEVRIVPGASVWMKAHSYWINDWPNSIDDMVGTITEDYTRLGMWSIRNDCHYELAIEGISCGVGVHPHFLKQI